MRVEKRGSTLSGCLCGQPGPSLGATTIDNRLTGFGFHPTAETVFASAFEIAGLKSTFTHGRVLMFWAG